MIVDQAAISAGFDLRRAMSETSEAEQPGYDRRKTATKR
jgi:hypothetical protein